MESGSVVVEGPLELRRTLQPFGGHFRPDGWWKAMRSPEGPAALHLRRRQEVIEFRAFGPGASWAAATVEGLVGADDDPAAFETGHPLVAELARRHRGWRIGRTRLVFEALLVAIVAQKVTGKESALGMKGLHARFSEQAPGPEPLVLSPDPARLAEAPYYEFHPLGIEQRRADTIRRVARDHFRIEALSTRTPATTSRYLQRIVGIGPWTAAETVAVSHGDPDAVSVGDFHLKNEVAWHLGGRPRGTDEEMLELLEEFRPQRGRVIRLLGTLGHAPAFGPRLPIRSIAGI